MKKILVIAACLCAMAVANAQSQINLANRVATSTPPIDAPVFDVGGVNRLTGPDAWAQLWAGTSEATLAPVGSPVQFRGAGTGAGYFPSTAVTLPGIGFGATATFQVKAWKGGAGSTYEAASERGQSAVLTATTSNPPAPGVPALTGLTSFSLVPEPSVLALGALAAAALLLRRRN